MAADPPANTIAGILAHSARHRGDEPALLAPERHPLSHAALAAQTRRVVSRLRSLGITAKSRVAVVLPNGPEMAAAFVGIAAGCACAPLNPNYRRADFEFYLKDLRAAALLVEGGSRSEAVEAARSLGLRVIETIRLECAGEFDLAAGDGGGADWLEAGDTALLLHTSGTTSRPKLVPLTAANLAASAAHIEAALALTPADRCLNIMPLFHIHGLMAAVLATLKAGASTVCTDGVYAQSFFAWLREFRPTWYSAVPTMHQALVARAAGQAALLRECPLRLVRSSSAPLAPQVNAALEEAFGAPVIESYGMTEAAHQMASNPLPPQVRKPGSVGRAAGPDVAVMDAEGRLLEPGAIGEVVIRGPNVMSGYEANAAANLAAFTDGWFRTGDQGYLDGDGYLYLTGRLKELINRGGEKIAPREIDEVLLTHRAVKQAVTFAIPHAQLGEEIGAAVELRQGEQIDGGALREWAGARLAAFKTPRVILVVDEIPTGPTGKLQRVGLAQRLGLETLDDTRVTAEFVPPRNDREERMAALWRQLLGSTRIGVRDRFEALGGDSLLAARMLAAVSAAEGLELPYARFLREGTIESLAREIEAGLREPHSPLVPVQPRGDWPPLYCLPGHDGLLARIARLSAALGERQPVWVFDLARITGGSTIEGLAAACVELLHQRQASGPYRLLGVCFGGSVAFEMACQLEEAGERVEQLIMITALNPAWSKGQSWAGVARAVSAQFRLRARYHARSLRSMGPASRFRYVTSRIAAFFESRREDVAILAGARLEGRARHRRLSAAWNPRSRAGSALVIRETGRHPDAPALGWSGLIGGELRVEDVPFHPKGPLDPERVGAVAQIISRRLDTIETAARAEETRAVAPASL